VPKEHCIQQFGRNTTVRKNINPISIYTNSKGLMNLVLAGPQEFFKQQLTKNEDQKPSFSKRNSAHFGEILTM
jgi:hypothetical protein